MILYRLAAALALVTLILLVAGALTGATGPLTPARADWLQAHRYLGMAAGALALVTVVGLFRSDSLKWLKSFGLTVLVLFAAQAWLGLSAANTPAVAAAHSVLSQVCFALLTLLALGLSPGWDREPAALEDRGWPSLRSLAWIAPPAILVQVVLGAAYRHDLASAVPHVSWAFIVILLILMLGTFTLTAIPADPAARARFQGLRRGAIGLIALVCVQLILGIGAFLARLSQVVNQPPGDLMAALRAAHLGAGALLLGFSVALSAELLRRAVPAASAEPAAPHPAGQGRAR